MDLNLSFGFSINRECFHFGSWSSPSLRQIYCTSLPSSRLAVPISGPSLLSFHVRVGDSSRVIVHFIVECATPSQARKVSRAANRQQGALVVSYLVAFALELIEGFDSVLPFTTEDVGNGALCGVA